MWTGLMPFGTKLMGIMRPIFTFKSWKKSNRPSIDCSSSIVLLMVQRPAWHHHHHHHHHHHRHHPSDTSPPPPPQDTQDHLLGHSPSVMADKKKYIYCVGFTLCLRPPHSPPQTTSCLAWLTNQSSSISYDWPSGCQAMSLSQPVT